MVIKIRRHELWKSNKALVERQNKQKEKSFTLALNEASDWTAEEVNLEFKINCERCFDIKPMLDWSLYYLGTIYKFPRYFPLYKTSNLLSMLKGGELQIGIH